MIDLRIFSQPATVDALAWTLLHFLWQGALLGFAAFTLLRLARPERATTRYAIGVATLAMMLITCVSTFVILSRQPAIDRDAPMVITRAALDVKPAIEETVKDGEGIRIEPSILGTAPAAWRPASLGPTASFVLVLAWGIGVLALSLRLLGGWMLTRSLTRHAISAVSPAIVAAAGVIGERLGLRRAVAIVESGAVAVPTLVGWVKPVVLLPAAALSGLSPEQLEAILAHELAHVRRHDYLVNLLQSMVETLLFYHPATWWVSAQVRAEREHCCDDLAVEVCGDRLVYVSALAELTTITSHRAFALAATDGSLVGRVQRILGRPRSVHEPAPAWVLLALIVLLAGGISSSAATSAAAVVPTAAAQKSPEPAKAIALPTEGTRKEKADRPIKVREDRDRKVEAVAPRKEAGSRVFKTPTEAFFGAQWFRGWFDWTPPPPPPPAPPAAPAASAPPAPPAAEVPDAPAPPPPPAAEAPQAPRAPEPPAPAAPPQEIGTRGSGNMSWSDGNERISIRWNGAFRLSDDEKDIAWMEDGATLTLADGVIFKSQVELRGVNGRIERTFTKNGTRRDYEPEGRAFLAAALDRMIKQSAAFAKERVAKFLKRGGPDAVLAEIDKLGTSSYTHRIYYTELARQADLSESLLTRILQRVPAEMSSDYDKATLFTAILTQSKIDDTHRAQIARAVGRIGSDYDQRRTLTAVMNVHPLSSSVAGAILEATGSINSDHDRAEVLLDLIEHNGVTSKNSNTFAGLVQSMSSSYDKRRVFTAFANQVNADRAVLSDMIKSAGSMTSSHDLSETLIAMIDKGGLTDASADAFFQSASEISSSYDLSRVLTKVVTRPGISERVLDGVLRSAQKVSSSHERANLLEAIAANGRLQGTARQLYIDATKGMSSLDGNRALAALVRAER